MSDLTDQAGAEVKREMEQMTAKTGSIALRIMVSGIRAVMNMGKTLTAKGLHQASYATLNAMKQIPGLPGAPDHGKMTVKQLQYKAGGDLHAAAIPDGLVKDMQKDLKTRGVDFAIEKAADGNTYVHFKGKDADSLSHALSQIKQKVEAKALDKPQTREDLKKGIEQKTAQKQAAKAKTPTPKKTPKIPAKGPSL